MLSIFFSKIEDSTSSKHQDRWSSRPKVSLFLNLDRYNAAFVTLQFNQNYLNSAERVLISQRVAFALSLNSWKVQESKYTYSQLQGRRLLQSAHEEHAEYAANHGEELIRASRNLQTLQQVTTSQVTFTVLPEPTSAVYPPPVQLATQLNLDVKKALMKSAFANFDTTFTIKPIEFKRYEVGFSTKPVVLNVSFNQMNMSCNLDNYGYVYAVAVSKDRDLGRPTSFQIANGLDYQNVPLPSGMVEISEKFVLFNLTIDFLDADTDYNLYISAGSAHPGYPDLMNDTKVVFLEFSTMKAPESRFLSDYRTETKYRECRNLQTSHRTAPAHHAVLHPLNYSTFLSIAYAAIISDYYAVGVN